MYAGGSPTYCGSWGPRCGNQAGPEGGYTVRLELPPYCRTRLPALTRCVDMRFALPACQASALTGEFFSAPASSLVYLLAEPRSRPSCLRSRPRKCLAMVLLAEVSALGSCKGCSIPQIRQGVQVAKKKQTGHSRN